MMVLVDTRRRTCHTLVLNYLVVGHGFTAFLDHFKLVVAWMWTMKESLAPVKHLLKHVPEDWVGGERCCCVPHALCRLAWPSMTPLPDSVLEVRHSIVTFMPWLLAESARRCPKLACQGRMRAHIGCI